MQQADRPVLIITGSSSGIGRCTARLFAQRGWDVGLVARGEDGLRSAAEEVRALGGRAAIAVADVADASGLERAAESLVTQLGPPDAWINAAGNGVYGHLLDVPEAEFRRVTEVTYLGTVNGTRVALRSMLPRDRGSIVNVCSGVVFHGLPLMASYAGAKAAVRGFSQSVRAELRLAGSRVHLCTVFPPAVNTPFFCHAPSYMGRPSRPVRPVYQPEIVAQALWLAVAGRRREMVVSGIVVAFSLVARASPTLAALLTERLRLDDLLSREARLPGVPEPSLFGPPQETPSVHGQFGKGARGWSLHVWWLTARQAVFRRASGGPRSGARSLPARARTDPHPAPEGSAPPAGLA